MAANMLGFNHPVNIRGELPSCPMHRSARSRPWFSTAWDSEFSFCFQSQGNVFWCGASFSLSNSTCSDLGFWK